MNLCFDECMPPVWFRRLNEFLHLRKSPIKAVHLLDMLKSGAKDDRIAEWLVEQDPPMMIISGDSGRKSRKGDPRLHLLCPRSGITSVFISPALCHEQGFEKVRMVMVCIPELERAYYGQRGLRYRLMRSGHLYCVQEWPVVAGSFSPIANFPRSSRPPFTLS